MSDDEVCVCGFRVQDNGDTYECGSVAARPGVCAYHLPVVVRALREKLRLLEEQRGPIVARLLQLEPEKPSYDEINGRLPNELGGLVRAFVAARNVVSAGAVSFRVASAVSRYRDLVSLERTTRSDLRPTQLSAVLSSLLGRDVAVSDYDAVRAAFRDGDEPIMKAACARLGALLGWDPLPSEVR